MRPMAHDAERIFVSAPCGTLLAVLGGVVTGVDTGVPVPALAGAPSVAISFPFCQAGSHNIKPLFSFSVTFTRRTLDKTEHPYTVHPLYIRPRAVHEAGVYHSVG